MTAPAGTSLQTLPPELVELLRADAGAWREVRPIAERDSVSVRVVDGDVPVVELDRAASP